MKYSIYLKHREGVFKVSDFDSLISTASLAFAGYLTRHYPVRFIMAPNGQDTVEEGYRALEDCRTGAIVWRTGELNCFLEQGEFYAEIQTQEECSGWEQGLTASKREIIKCEILKAWRKGFAEGGSKEKQCKPVLAANHV